MIEKIGIKGLKSINELEVKCNKLNLIVGVNSSGKSSFLQAILLFAQNTLAEEGLNGKLISLGEFREILNHYSGNTSSIELKFWGDGCDTESIISFLQDDEGEDYKIEKYIKGLDDDQLLMEDIVGLENDELGYCLGIEDVYYLSCHRIGAKDLYEKNIRKVFRFGLNGEYALSYLLYNGDNTISEKLVYDKNTQNTLIAQVNYWLNAVVGTTIHIDDIRKSNYLQVTYNNNPKNNNAFNMYNRPMNIGSGVSYLISILISCLGTEEESVIIIENPEIHLHPKAQSKLCEFFYFIADSGRQLFIESHSDHIFNGIRAGIADGSMKSDIIAVDFFGLDENFQTQCNPIVIDKYGNLTGVNPNMSLDDLFDQFDIDLERMLYGSSRE